MTGITGLATGYAIYYTTVYMKKYFYVIFNSYVMPVSQTPRFKKNLLSVSQDHRELGLHDRVYQGEHIFAVLVPHKVTIDIEKVLTN